MTADDSTLEIALEDVGGTSWKARLLTTLTSQYGSGTLRFVAQINDERLFESEPFFAAGSIGPLPPEEDWAPGMTEGLTKLRQEIKRSGWIEVGHGEEPWAFRYKKAASGSG